MTFTERIFHMVLFEVLLLVLTTVIVVFFTDYQPMNVAGVAIALSLIAMVWNFVYNLFFDKIFTEEKTNRSFLLRAMHAVFFEFGLLFFSLPLIAWTLKVSLWEAFIIDIGLTILVVIYTLIFNWVYDHARAKFFMS